MAKIGPRENITMKCTICGNETKRTSKNKKNDPDRLELSIYCPKCGKHTIHREKK